MISKEAKQKIIDEFFDEDMEVTCIRKVDFVATLNAMPEERVISKEEKQKLEENWQMWKANCLQWEEKYHALLGDSGNQIAKRKIEEFELTLDTEGTPRIIITEALMMLKNWLDKGGDPLASPDATWEELGRGFIANEPDMTEGGE